MRIVIGREMFIISRPGLDYSSMYRERIVCRNFCVQINAANDPVNEREHSNKGQSELCSGRLSLEFSAEWKGGYNGESGGDSWSYEPMNNER